MSFPKVIQRIDFMRRILLRMQYLAWKLLSQSVPKYAKYVLLSQLATKNRIRQVIETGTYLGDFVWYMAKQGVEHIYSIEISSYLYQRAKASFGRNNNVHLFLGDSRDVLPLILKNITHPALFWLDAHYSGGSTEGKGSNPVLEELKAILDHAAYYRHNHIIVIDDARLFTGLSNFPRLNDILKFNVQMMYLRSSDREPFMPS